MQPNKTRTRWTVRRHGVGYALYYDGQLVSVTSESPLDFAGIVATMSSDPS
jgi:hypothetical protein